MSTTSPPNLDSLTTSLLALLDTYNNLKGAHLFPHPDPSARPETTLPPLPTDGTPIAIQMNTTPSLATHLLAQTKDLETLAALSEEIRTFLKNHPQASPAAHERLNATYRDLLASHPQPSTAAAKPLNAPDFDAVTKLAQKLANLRQVQHHFSSTSVSTSQESKSRSPEFLTMLVADIDSTGRPDPMLNIYLPVDIDWPTYSQALRVNTHCRWTQVIDEDVALDSDPLTPQDDGGDGGGGDTWKYQRTSPTGAFEGIARHLENEDDFYDILPSSGGDCGSNKSGGNREKEKEWSGAPLVWPVSSSLSFPFLPHTFFLLLFDLLTFLIIILDANLQGLDGSASS